MPTVGIEQLISTSNIYLSASEIAQMEQCDFGLGQFDVIGLALHTYINTARCCAKELFLLPHQTCPEHLHPNCGTRLGKEETFRCRFGCVSIFIVGEPTLNPQCSAPMNGQQYYTAKHEVVLTQGQQLTLAPNSLHWFQAHGNGAVLSEFSTHSDDSGDIFTDPRINRFSLI